MKNMQNIDHNKQDAAGDPSRGENSGDSPDKPTIAEIGEEASNRQPDEILREVLRGDETKGDPDSRDIVGAARREDTPQGREEAKNDTTEKANTNG